MGHVVSDNGIEENPRKNEVVKNTKKPLTPTNIRSFFGLAGYYHRFVEDFYPIAASRTTLTKKIPCLNGWRLVKEFPRAQGQTHISLNAYFA